MAELIIISLILLYTGFVVGKKVRALKRGKGCSCSECGRCDECNSKKKFK